MSEELAQPLSGAFFVLQQESIVWASRLEAAVGAQHGSLVFEEPHSFWGATKKVIAGREKIQCFFSTSEIDKDRTDM